MRVGDTCGFYCSYNLESLLRRYDQRFVLITHFILILKVSMLIRRYLLSLYDLFDFLRPICLTLNSGQKVTLDHLPTSRIQSLLIAALRELDGASAPSVWARKAGRIRVREERGWGTARSGSPRTEWL